MRLGHKVTIALATALPLAAAPAAVASSAPVGHPARYAAAAATPITHIVVLMQENHTFDNELGYWCAQTGRCLGMPAKVTLKGGIVVTPSVTADIVPVVGHTVKAQTAAIDGGAMDGWAKVQGCTPPAYACVSGYEPSSVPNLTSLASTYAVLDHAFYQAETPTWGGHMEEFAATTDGFSGDDPHSITGPGWGCDSGGLAPTFAGTNEPSCVPDYSLPAAQYPYGGAFEPTTIQQVPTILTEMDSASVSWKIYSATAAEGGYRLSGCPTFASCVYTSEDNQLVTSAQFFTDAKAGTLPNVSFLMPAGSTDIRYDQHNTQSNAAGDNWIGKVASAIMGSPDWSSTAFIITYDDCGCFYDQVPPPVGPDGRQDGPRAPFVIVSPYAKSGYTDSTPTTSTGSILAFIEADFGLPALNANDAHAYNLMGAFNFTAAPQLTHPRMLWRKLPASDYRVNPAALKDLSDGT